MNGPLPSVTFLGLGLMGSRMAHRILAAGYPLTVYNRDARKMAPLVTAGATSAPSPRQAARGAQIVISMVADDAAAREIWLGDQGALAGAEPGTVLLECSTVTPTWIQDLADHAKRAHCQLLDAPVTGSRDQAAAGELTFLVGGPADALQSIVSVLRTMGRTILAVGANGSGARLKLINNFVCGVEIAALAEAIALIERSGLDRNQAITILTAGASGSPLVKTVASRIMAGDYTPNFLLRLMAKDLAYAELEARQAGLELTTARTALAMFQRGVEHGLGEQDIAAVFEPLRRLAVPP